MLPVFLALALALALTCSARAENGVTDSEVVVGMTSASSGPIGPSATSYVKGIKLAFEMANAGGKIHGRQIRTVFYDDAYEPSKTHTNTKKLISEDKVFLLTGYNGTPTLKAAVPAVIDAKIPLLFPRTGDMFVRAKHNKYIFNMRASFEDEALELVKATQARKHARLAVFFQTDAYGDSVKSAMVTALKERGLIKDSKPFVSEGSMPRAGGDAQQLEEAFKRIEAGNPQAVILGAATGPSEQFIRLAHKKGKNWTYYVMASTSFVVQAIKDIETEFVSTQVVPDPDSSLPVAVEFSQNLKENLEAPSRYAAFEGYLNGRIIVESMRRAGPNLTRESLIKALAGDAYDLGGYKVAWTEKNHNGLRTTYLIERKTGGPKP